MIPSLDESMLVIRVRKGIKVDSYLLSMIDGAFMSRDEHRRAGWQMGFTMELILRPLIQQLIETGKDHPSQKSLTMRASLIHAGTPAGRLQLRPRHATVETGTMVVRQRSDGPTGRHHAMRWPNNSSMRATAPRLARTGTAGRHPATGRQRLAQRSPG